MSVKEQADYHKAIAQALDSMLQAHKSVYEAGTSLVYATHNLNCASTYFDDGEEPAYLNELMASVAKIDDDLDAISRAMSEFGPAD